MIQKFITQPQNCNIRWTWLRINNVSFVIWLIFRPAPRFEMGKAWHLQIQARRHAGLTYLLVWYAKKRSPKTRLIYSGNQLSSLAILCGSKIVIKEWRTNNKTVIQWMNLLEEIWKSKSSIIQMQSGNTSLAVQGYETPLCERKSI